jgi:D-lactate dehydrogenase
MNKMLNVVNVAHSVLGAWPIKTISSALNKVTNHIVPEWNPYMPKGAAPLNMTPEVPVNAQTDKGIPRKVVYVPACVTRIMGPSKGDYEEGECSKQVAGCCLSCCSGNCGCSKPSIFGIHASAEPVHAKLLSLFNKAGYEVVYPEGLESSCCGMMFNSRGFKDAAAKKGSELEAALLKASGEQGLLFYP